MLHFKSEPVRRWDLLARIHSFDDLRQIVPLLSTWAIDNLL